MLALARVRFPTEVVVAPRVIVVLPKVAEVVIMLIVPVVVIGPPVNPVPVAMDVTVPFDV
jgi:hypothetical protein